MSERRETRKLIVCNDKLELYSAITLAFRRTRIHTNLLGSDLLTGVIFGKIRHPEITVKKAVEDAVEASKIPGGVASFEEGLDRIIEVLEVSSQKDVLYAERIEQKEKIIEEVVEAFSDTIRIDFCYKVASRVFFESEEKTMEKYSFGADLIRSMLFKKLYDPDSSFQCTIDYALKKIGKLMTEEASIDNLLKYVSAFISGGSLEDKKNSLKNLLEKLEEKAYEKFPSVPSE